MKRLIPLLLLCASTTLIGCKDFTIHTPDGFAELDDQDEYGYRATNAEGVVLAVRREANEPYGDLSFWSGALDAHLRRSGYTAVATESVQAAAGMTGKQLRYKKQRDGREHIFWLTVFVTESEVITIEAGGDVAFFGNVEKSVSRAISAFTTT